MPQQRTIPCVCHRCGGTFLVTLSDAKRGRGTYCSRECYQRSCIERTRPLSERFWSKVDRSGGPDACWPWTAARDGHGYGVLRVGSKGDGTARNMSAHRLAWILIRGPIPAETPNVLHRCDNPPCCNVERCHFLGTVADNTADMMKKARNGFRRQVGEHNPASTISAAAVAQMRDRHTAGESITALSRTFGIAYVTAWAIVTGRTRRSG